MRPVFGQLLRTAFKVGCWPATFGQHLGNSWQLLADSSNLCNLLGHIFATFSNVWHQLFNLTDIDNLLLSMAVYGNLYQIKAQFLRPEESARNESLWVQQSTLKVEQL